MTMQIISGFDFAYFDVDDTLVMWDSHLINLYPDDIVVFDNPDDASLKWALLPNHRTIKALKKHKESGSTVVVWSAGGWDWALEVVRKLELEDYVDLVTSKPTRYYDDLPASQFMGTRYDLSVAPIEA